MGYLQVLNLMIKAYKAARGVLPKGLDLLKLQQKARQKVIDSKKVIQFPKDRITNPFKPRPTKPEGTIPVTVKGKTSKMSPEGIMNMLMKQGKGKDVKIGQAPKTTKVKEAVDPKLVMQESTRELYKKLTRQNREAIRNFKKRNKDDPTKKAYGGRVNFNTGGGISNVIGTYLSNPTLQDRYTQQQYEDLFGVGTTQPQTVSSLLQNQVQPTRVAAAPVVPPVIKPIIIPGQEGDGGSGITNVNRNKNFDYETEAYGINPTGLSKDVFDYEYEAANEDKGILQTLLSMSPALNAFKFVRDKGVAAKNRFDDFMEDQRNKRIQEEKDAAQREFDRLNALRQIRDAESMSGGPGETTQGTFGSSVNDPSTFSDYS
tara:strand:+ start:235 stop:1353 length:1119 start_codon:yes stop_codon:yes gene_type:complete